MLHHIDCQFINTEKSVTCFFTEKQNHLFPRMTMTLNEMLADPLTSNMKQYLVVFQNEDIPQAYGIFGKTLKIVDMRNHII